MEANHAHEHAGTAQITLDYQTVRPGEAVEAQVLGYVGGDGVVRTLDEIGEAPTFEWEALDGGSLSTTTGERTTFITNGLAHGDHRIVVTIHDEGGEVATGEATITLVGEAPGTRAGSPLSVRLERSLAGDTPEETLWRVIDDRTDAIGWSRFAPFMGSVICDEDDRLNDALRAVRNGFDYRSRIDAYRFVRHATEEFLRYQCGLLPPDGGQNGWRSELSAADLATLRDDYLQELAEPDVGGPVLPYLRIIRAGLAEVPVKDPMAIPDRGCYGLSGNALTRPCMVELIWSYWMEQGMLVQTMAALATRFQNRAGSRVPDPLASFEIDPLRPANNLLWGYLQTEHERLSLARRAYEYHHHYGLTVSGKAVRNLQPAETRSRFLEAFHTVLHVTSRFYEQDDDNTISADAFPVLNALRDLHLVLAEGAHNQYGDLPWTSRVEMLTQQWILARPEVREFLGHRAMVPYPEAWMPRVDAMRTLQGWGDTSVRHFRELAVSGEKLLLSVRFGGWSDTSGVVSAASWARHWRQRIHDYVHSYRAVTGVDLTLNQTATRLARDLFEQPSSYIQKRRTPTGTRG